MYVPPFPRWLRGKESTCQCRGLRRQGFNPWVRKIPWSRKWHPNGITWNIPWTEEPGRLQSIWLQRIEQDWAHTQAPFSNRETFGKLCNSSEFLVFFVYRLAVIILVQSNNTYSCPTFCHPMDCSMPGFPVFHCLLEFAQIHVDWVHDTIQPSHSLLTPSPSVLNLSQYQDLFQWVSLLHQVAKVQALQLQHHSFQWIFRVDFL